MYTIISGTNRKNSMTLKMAVQYAKLLSEHNIPNQLLDLSDLPKDFIFSALYGEDNPKFNDILDQYILNAEGLIIISPEYNGSYPGILKAFIDGWSPKKLMVKKAALVGISSGRQGNSRGIDQLTNVLNYLAFVVAPFKIPISKVGSVLDENGIITDEELKNSIKKQINQIINIKS
jgi:chromate reductase